MSPEGTANGSTLRNMDLLASDRARTRIGFEMIGNTRFVFNQNRRTVVIADPRLIGNSPELCDGLQGSGSDVAMLLSYRRWRQSSLPRRPLDLDNKDRDAIMADDSPLCGAERFLRNPVRRYDHRNT